MPQKKASAKAWRQTKKHAVRNLLAKARIADARIAARKALAIKDLKKAEAAVKDAIKLLDKAYSRGILKLNAVSRYKSRLLKKLASAKSGK